MLVTSTCIALILDSSLNTLSNLIAMHNLCLVYDKIPYSGSYVLAVACCGVGLCSNIFINFYEPIIWKNTHSRCGLDLLERTCFSN